MTERKERYDKARTELFTRGASTGPIEVLEAFCAVPVRKDDDPRQARGVEALRPGDVVELPIHPEKNKNQSLEMVAVLYAKGHFEPTKKDLTEFHDHARHPESVQAEESERAAKKAAAGKAA